MTTTHTPLIDEHGIEHRYGCHMPGWTSKPSRVPGFHILRCPTCGTVRVARAKEQTTAKVEP
jgi:hypothetical protein